MHFYVQSRVDMLLYFWSNIMSVNFVLYYSWYVFVEVCVVQACFFFVCSVLPLSVYCGLFLDPDFVFIVIFVRFCVSYTDVTIKVWHKALIYSWLSSASRVRHAIANIRHIIDIDRGTDNPGRSSNIVQSRFLILNTRPNCIL
jgi:hypothetical protein